MIRVLTWNVARRTARLTEQVAAVGRREPDILVLQEVTARTLPLWREACRSHGLAEVVASLEGADPQREPANRRRTGVMIASRFPAEELRALEVPWQETAAAAQVETDAGRIEVHAVHVPNAANGWVKPETLRAIRGGLARPCELPRILCGDLNTPRRELPDGTVTSFARDSHGRLRRDCGQEWDDAELGVVPGLRELGFTDVFRFLHGYAERSPSWTWSEIAGHTDGWRIDHLFCSWELRPAACAYHHAWRKDSLSDHAPLEAELEMFG